MMLHPSPKELLHGPGQHGPKVTCTRKGALWGWSVLNENFIVNQSDQAELWSMVVRIRQEKEGLVQCEE